MSRVPVNVLDRMVLGVEKVRERLLRAAGALEKAGVAYAVAGGNAVAAWVATVDISAVRNTQDVDILLQRADLEKAAKALEAAGFVRRHVAGMEIFLDGPQAKVREAVHVIMAGEKVRPEYMAAAPQVGDAKRLGTPPRAGDQVTTGGLWIVDLGALVRMKLTSFRRKDQVHLLDMLEAGLIDASWVGRLGPLGPRLQELIDSPEG
jgi:hypothetical protein